MPTGYTAIIEEKADVTFREFALLCARAMGPCIDQREERMDNPPRHREVTAYHREEKEKAQATHAKLRAMTDQDKQAAYAEHIAELAERNARFAASHNRVAGAYARMLVMVEAWQPPTPNHQNFKKFMRDQIGLCYKPNEKPAQDTPVESAEVLHANGLKNAEEDVEYHAKKYEEEIEGVAASNAWIDALYAALPPDPASASSAPAG
jgi:hypothetical protein